MEVLDYPSPDYPDTIEIDYEEYQKMEEQIRILENFKDEVLAIASEPEDYLDDLHQIVEECKSCDKELKRS